MEGKCCCLPAPTAAMPSRYSAAVSQNEGSALDVILVEQPDGSLASTDWFCLFSHLPQPSEVAVRINGQPLHASLHAAAPFEPASFEGGAHIPPAGVLRTLATSPSLREGRNEICYTTAADGASVRASIYLWKKGARAVVFDVDGTVTLNDVVGHVGNVLDQSFVHRGVCELACQLDARGYSLVFLTSRTLLGTAGADRTRRYLFEVAMDSETGYRMPEAPVITTRHVSTMTALAHELGGQSGKFKTAVLQSLDSLVSARMPRLFYAGFGNREKDALAYLSAGVPPERVLIIDPSSLISARTSSTAMAVADAATKPSEATKPSQWLTYTALLPELDTLFPRLSTEERFAETFAAHAAKAAQGIAARGI